MDVSIVNHKIVNPERVESSENRELKKACQGFEAIFLKNMLKNMRGSVAGDNLFATDNHGMNIYKSMQDEYLAEALSEQGSGIGLGEFLYNKLRDKY